MASSMTEGAFFYDVFLLTILVVPLYMTCTEFENSVRISLEKCLLELGTCIDRASRMGVAVSGGADSISLLVSLESILKHTGCTLYAVTVNHNLREEEETSGDAAFVEKTCRELGVECFRFDVERGLIVAGQIKNKSSLEDEARKVRYGVFKRFIEEKNLSCLCLAHNRNDDVETVTMRFLQGSSVLSGIPSVREKYIRPLLGISRKEIEMYLFQKKIGFRIDSTNSDSSFYRNRIRNKIIPCLDEFVPGWQKSVLMLSKKNRIDDDFMKAEAEMSLSKIGYEKKGNESSFDAVEFYALHKAVRIRILQKISFESKADDRISWNFIEKCSEIDFMNEKKSSCAGLEFSIEGRIFFIRKKKLRVSDSGFCHIVEENCTLSVSGVDVFVRKAGHSVELSSVHDRIVLEGLNFPFLIRSRQLNDFVKCADKTYRSVSKIFDDWKVREKKNLIPIVQRLSPSEETYPLEICCIWGSILGFKNWIVRNEK